MLGRTALAVLMVTAFGTNAVAQTRIVLVRHAERADTASGGAPMMAPNPAAMTAADPGLSPAGLARATALAAVLKDTKLTAIYATEFKRTQQTATPTSEAQHVPVTVVSAKDTAALVGKLKAATGSVLVVGHSNTVNEVIKALGVTTPVSIGDSEFDNLFIVTMADSGLIHLRYR